MKKVTSVVLCLIVFSVLFISASAHEGHDHSTLSLNVSTVVVPNELDQDGDGIPDYMDSLVDLDGDGMNDLGPTYQDPPVKGKQDNASDKTWIMVLIIFVFLGVVTSTVYLKTKTKDAPKEREE